MSLSPDLRAALLSCSEEVREDSESLGLYGRDRTSAWVAAPSAVVFPRNSADVVEIVRLANLHRLALVPSGGRTGLSGGAVAHAGELVVSMDRMRRILSFDAVDRCVRCEAGVVLQELQQFALAQGLCYPVDFAASGSAQLGGSIATNAGGIKVIRYGMTRQWVQGLQVVTGGGELLELNGSLMKNNSGYDLRQLFIGSEGTLGIITEAVMRLGDAPPATAVMLLALPRLERAMDVLACSRRELQLTAFEFFSHAGMSRVIERLAVAAPFSTPAPYYLLLEFECASQDEIAQQVFLRCLEEQWISDGILSQSLAQAQALWRLRESLSETLAPCAPRKYDVAVPVHAVPAFVAELEQGLGERAAALECVLWGHIGDGNLHVNLLRRQTLDEDAFRRLLEPLSHWLAELVVGYGGSISAEHGIGLEKKAYLHHMRSAADIGLMRGIKQLLDPRCVMNPGKIFDTQPG